MKFVLHFAFILSIKINVVVDFSTQVVPSLQKIMLSIYFIDR
jgi:hypothetical protein